VVLEGLVTGHAASRTHNQEDIVKMNKRLVTFRIGILASEVEGRRLKLRDGKLDIRDQSGLALDRHSHGYHLKAAVEVGRFEVTR
jgi:hypothetical protein